MKEMDVSLLPYLSFKAISAITVSVYYMIYQSNTYSGTLSQG